MPQEWWKVEKLMEVIILSILSRPFIHLPYSSKAWDSQPPDGFDQMDGSLRGAAPLAELPFSPILALISMAVTNFSCQNSLLQCTAVCCSYRTLIVILGLFFFPLHLNTLELTMFILTVTMLRLISTLINQFCSILGSVLFFHSFSLSVRWILLNTELSKNRVKRCLKVLGGSAILQRAARLS